MRYTFRTDRLVFVAASMELMQGLTILAIPSQFDAAAYDPIRDYFPQFATLLVAGGVILLLMQRYARHPFLRRGLAVIPALPLLVLAWLFGLAAVWTGAVQYGMLALSILLLPWLQEEPENGLDLGALTLGFVSLPIGGLMLFGPSSFSPVSYAPIYHLLPIIGTVGLIGAVVLVSPLYRPELPRYTTMNAVGAVLPLVLAGNFVATRIWTGLGWGIWGLSFLLEPTVRWLQSRLGAKPVTDDEEARNLLATEHMLEAWTWVLTLVVAALTATERMNQVVGPLRSTLFVIALAVYNGGAYLFLPRLGTSPERIVAHLGFLSLAVGYLLFDSQSIGLSMLTLLVAIPPIATRAAGVKVGRWMLALVLVVAPASQVMAWLDGRQPLSYTVVALLFQLMILGTASWLGHASVASERKVVQELKASRAEIRRQFDKLSLLLQITATVRGSLDLDRISAGAVEALGKALQVERAYLRLVESETVLVQEYTAPGVESLLASGPLPSSTAFRGRQTIIHADIANDRAFEERDPEVYEFLLRVGARASMATPLLVDGQMLGVLAVQSARPRQWIDEDIKLLEEVGMQVGVALALGQTHQVLLSQYEELQDAHQNLQSAHEELVAQEEELQHLNDALRNSEARFASLLSIAPNAILAIDQAHRIIFFNREATEIFGYEAWEVEGRPLEILLPQRFVGVHQTHVNGFAHSDRPARKMGERMQMELVGRRKNGAEFPVEIAISHFMVQGEMFFTAIIQDVTERKRTEQVLRESEERFRSAFEHAPIGVALLGADAQWTQVNRALCDMLGYTESELLALDLESLIHPEDREKLYHQISALSTGGSRSTQNEFRFRHRAGHDVWVLQSCSAIADGQATPSFIAQVQDITDRKRYEATLVHLANHDPLTELINRRRFEEELESYLALARNFSVRGALFFLDLDLFKYVNDTLGHHAGDDLLRRVAGILRERLRETDVIARLGGDEFAVLLPYTGEEAVVLAEQVLEALRQEMILGAGRSVTITGSIGITFFPDHGLKAEDLLAHADVAMYRAKEQGRNTYALFSAEGDWKEQMESKLSWERRLRDALRKDRFSLHFQPILDLRSDVVTHHELLLRMVEEDGSLVMPGAFLGVAERYGLIYEIDRWVVREAIRLIAEHQRKGENRVFEVNLSGKTLSDPDLLPMIQRELTANEVLPGNLVFEITETAAIHDLDQARRFIDAMKGLGCRFALDDVGAGFSSLYFLKHLAVDYIKIDGSFVRNLPHDPADQHLVKALVAVARELKRETIAEFVDSEETLRLLREYGVDYAQGFLIGRPGPLPVD